MDTNKPIKKLKKVVKRKKTLADKDEILSQTRPKLALKKKKKQGTSKTLSELPKTDESPPKKKKLNLLNDSEAHNSKAGNKKPKSLVKENGVNTSLTSTSDADNVGSEKSKKPIALFESDDELSEDHVSEFNGGIGEDSDIEMDDDFGSNDSVDGSASGDGADSEDELPIEKKSRLLDKRKQRTADEGESELRLNIAGQQKYELPTVDEVEKQLKELPNLQIIRDRINEVIQ
ncbi:hypothetical protein GCK32_015550, partial [Trichostrongylus colubriformis]